MREEYVGRSLLGRTRTPTDLDADQWTPLVQVTW